MTDPTASGGRAQNEGTIRLTVRGPRPPVRVRECELRNVIERAVALHPAPVLGQSALILGRTRAGRDSRSRPSEASASTPAVSLEEAERRAIVAALEATGWNKTGAARILGIARITLREKIDRYGIKPS